MIVTSIQPRLQHALALLLVAAVPAWDVVETRRLRRAPDPGAKTRVYRRIVALLGLLTVGAVIAMTPADLLYPPSLGGALGRWAGASAAAVPLLLGIFAGLGAQLVIPLLVPRARTRMAAPLGKFEWFLPSSPAERRWWVAVSVAAGVCEEVLYRGFLIRYLAALPLGLGGAGAALVAVLVAALVFGAAHTYQGVAGMLGTAAAGLLFTALFVSTGALWLPMLVHAAIDLRVLLLWPASAAPGAAPSAGPDRAAG